MLGTGVDELVLDETSMGREHGQRIDAPRPELGGLAGPVDGEVGLPDLVEGFGGVPEPGSDLAVAGVGADDGVDVAVEHGESPIVPLETQRSRRSGTDQRSDSGGAGPSVARTSSGRFQYARMPTSPSAGAWAIGSISK